MLLEALAISKNPVYCDTDSIICTDYFGDIDASRLGAWKNEGEADSLFIAGKKLYAAFLDGECVKLASKGARLTPSDVVSICRGGEVEWSNDAPSFSLSRETNFVRRKITKRITEPKLFGV